VIRESERGGGPDAHWREIRREIIPARTRWERRAGQWRAVRIARMVFGDRTTGRLEGFPPRGGFSGLLHLEVPFHDLEDHRARERLFLALAGADPVLARVPLVFSFAPDPGKRPRDLQDTVVQGE
jgi:hypothetical protein